MRITLVLGSGGARGYAHIGAIQELEARGHEVVAITSCSMGAVVGAVYAAGKLDDFEGLVRKIEVRDVLRYMDPALGAPGMIKAGRIMDMLGSFLGDLNVEDLPIPYLAVAADMYNRREVWFMAGPLLTAIRASIAIPTAFTPIMLQGRLLADGGLLNPLPVDAAAMYPADAVVAVSLSGRQVNLARHAAADQPLQFSRPSTNGTPQPWTRLRQGADELLGGAGVRALFEKFTGQAHDPDAAEPGELTSGGNAVHVRGRSPEPLPRGLNTLDMTTMALNTMQMSIESTRTAATPPDVLISIPIDACGPMDFHRATEMIELGRERAIAAYDAAGL